MTRDLFDCLMALLLSGEENQGPASDAYEVCVCKGWAEGRTVTAAGLEALKPYKVRNAVIMAAGFSSRFAPLSYECPKGLVKIKGEVLVERQIRQLQEAGILEIIVVVGYRKEDFYYLSEKFGIFDEKQSFKPYGCEGTNFKYVCLFCRQLLYSKSL